MNKITSCLLVFWVVSLGPFVYAGAPPVRHPRNQAAKAAQKQTAEPLPAGDWPDADRGVEGMLFSPLTQITAENAANLVKVCSYTFPAKEPAESSPVVWDGIVYATSAEYTVAIDGSDCQVKWLSHWKLRGPAGLGTQRGAVYADGKIIRGTRDDYLIEMNAENGHVIWARQIADPRKGYSISMSPLVRDGLIYVGPAGAESASSGWVGAFRLSNGSLVWKFHVVPRDGQPGADTWGRNPHARAHGGGNSWTEYSFDPARDLLLVPGGNAAPDFYGQSRPGSNLYTNSIIALNAKTGQMVWYYQFIPHDTHDYDVTHTSPVFQTEIDGKMEPVVASTGKDGMLNLVNRDTHQLIYSVPFATQLNSKQPLTTKPTRVCPGTLGGQEWDSSAYDPKLNLLIVPTVDWCTTEWAASKSPSVAAVRKGELYFGGGREFDPWSKASGRITAFDASTGKEVWRLMTSEPMLGGVAVTASDLVFTGELTGDFDVLNARTGKILCQYPLHDQVEGGVVTYLANGKQYVAVLSGAGAVFSQMEPQIGGGNPTVTIFGLKGK